MLPERYCVIHVETTGRRPTQDRIVEVACASRWRTNRRSMGDAGESRSTDSADCNQRPRNHPTRWSRRAPSVTWALRFVRRWCRGRTVAAHCANFDLSFVGPSVATRGLCTMRLARALFPEAPNHKNQTLRHFLAIDRAAGERFEAHRALGDALVSAHVLIACRRRVEAYRGGESWARFLAETAFVSVRQPHQSAVAARSLNAQRRFASANAVAARARRGTSSPLEVAIE